MSSYTSQQGRSRLPLPGAGGCLGCGGNGFLGWPVHGGQGVNMDGLRCAWGPHHSLPLLSLSIPLLLSSKYSSETASSSSTFRLNGFMTSAFLSSNWRLFYRGRDDLVEDYEKKYFHFLKKKQQQWMSLNTDVKKETMKENSVFLSHPLPTGPSLTWTLILKFIDILVMFHWI